MAAVVQQLLSFLFLLWVVAAEFPAGPEWEWVSSMAEMGGKEFGEVADPLVKMTRNGELFPKISPIDGWELSAKIDPLWQAEGQGVLALVYEEVGVGEEVKEGPERQATRAVIAFRGKDAAGNPIDECAVEMMSDNPAEEVNATLRKWCFETYNASSFDYYGQAVAYTMQVLEWYATRSVLLCGTSMGGMVVDLAAAGLATHYLIDLPVLAFLNPGTRRAMVALGVSLQGHHTALMGCANRWDPKVMLDWDNRIGSMCLFTTPEPPICTSCFASMQSSSQACHQCARLTHNALLLVRLMLEGLNPTCYLMEGDKSLPVADYG